MLGSTTKFSAYASVCGCRRSVRLLAPDPTPYFRNTASYHTPKKLVLRTSKQCFESNENVFGLVFNVFGLALN